VDRERGAATYAALAFFPVFPSAFRFATHRWRIRSAASVAAIKGPDTEIAVTLTVAVAALR